MEAVLDLGCSIAVPAQIIEKLAESIRSAFEEVGEELELMEQKLAGFMEAEALPKHDREKIDTPYRPVCNKAVLLDKRHSVHRCRNTI